MQNAAKYAGDDARVTVRVSSDGSSLFFEVIDDGAGFDPEFTSESHGFVNMRDRVGAHGGDLVVESAPGRGTRVAGRLPSSPVAD
jgi:signal transduction histidine kinase